MRPSQFHRNRKFHNWLSYKNMDKLLTDCSKYFKGRLVDLGCGEAPYKAFFLQYADEYVGVDWANTLHDSKAEVISNLNEGIELDDEYADSIVSLSVMEHLCEPQIFLNESHRILRREGTMILQVPWQWWVHEAPYDYFRYTPYGLKYMFEKAGFVDVKVTASSGFFTMWLLKINYFSRRFIRGPRPLRWLIMAILIPFWTINQLIAPILDRLDRHKELESSGYYVVARKEEVPSGLE